MRRRRAWITSFGAQLSLIVFIMTALFSTAAWAAATESVLYSFQGVPDGSAPRGRLVMDEAGNLYGATLVGGVDDPTCQFGTCGTVFQLTPPSGFGGNWSETVLYNFQGHAFNDGNSPTGGLIWGKGHKLYGVTAYGGNGPCLLLGSPSGCGVVYEMTPPATSGGAWTESVIYNFQGGSDGYWPLGELVADKDGNLYGSTNFGGGYGVCDDGIYPYCGTVFELSPPATSGGAWTEKVLHSFRSGTDGAQPNGSLILDGAGALYGTTFNGGNTGCNIGSAVGCGTVFKLTPPCEEEDVWHESVLYRFPAEGRQGVTPLGGLIFDKSGNLYGTAEYGGSVLPTAGGTVFELSPPAEANQHWRLTTLFNFSTDGNSGGLPTSGLIFDRRGDLYGTASSDGAYYAGTVFRLQPPATAKKTWTYSVLYAFQRKPDAAVPDGALMFDERGNLYGVTSVGGDGTACVSGGAGCGTVYEIAP